MAMLEWDTLTLEQQQWLERELKGTIEKQDDSDDGRVSMEKECKKRKAHRHKVNHTWASAYKEPVVDSTEETENETGKESK
jgi:hypothetical protein